MVISDLMIYGIKEKSMAVCKFKSPAPGTPCKHYLRLPDSSEPGLCNLDHIFHCTEALKSKLPSLSVSSAKDYISCRMKYFYHKIQGIESIPSKLPIPMKAGRIWDEYMNLTYSGPDASNESFEKALSDTQLSDQSAAQVQALIYAFQELEIHTDLCKPQRILKSIILRSNLVGIVDRDYRNYFVETKLSSRPNFYDHIESIRFQAGTYFLLNPDYEYMILEVTRLPGLRIKPTEFLEEYTSRIKSDIIKRPSYYFIGLNRKSMKFGKKFMRSEFNLNELKQTYKIVSQDIRRSIQNNDWYKNELSCYSPGKCMYLPICRTNTISESLYRVQDKSRKLK